MDANLIQKAERIGKSYTLKGLIIGFLTLIMLIPGVMIQNLIQERQQRSEETILKINEKWSLEQMLNGPYLVIPYRLRTTTEKGEAQMEQHKLVVTPEALNINGFIEPEVRHYGIYKSILYKSSLTLSGSFSTASIHFPSDALPDFGAATIRIGISDLRGMKNNPDIVFANAHYMAETGGIKDLIGEGLEVALNKNTAWQHMDRIPFSCQMQLNGSTALHFIPSGRTTNVVLKGNWASPGFIGSFSPDYSLDKSGFKAKWSVLHFNRNIPSSWSDDQATPLQSTSFGINLVDTVDHYQQNMRSAKYAIMFIMLTFVVFFFVEIITGNRIHPIQYLLVGVALLLFFTLLLSLSEQIMFGVAYLIASLATILLITLYIQSVFKNKWHSVYICGFLSVLYLFLYVILQLEDVALLIGSIGLFIVLAVVMFVSRKVNWYNR